MDDLQNSIEAGPPQDPPTGRYLQKCFWDLNDTLVITPAIWKRLVKEYVEDERFVGKSTATPEERMSRLTTALSRGSIKHLQPDLTWKRFIEGLVFLKIQSLRVTATAKRGNWGESKTVSAITRPETDHLRAVNKEDEEVSTESVGRTLNRFFDNPDKTATRVMEHILLKLFWQFIAAYKIDSRRWKELLIAYVNNPKNCPQIKSRRNDARHNLQQSIRRTKKLTWRFFLKALQAIDVRELKMAFLFTTESGKEIECYFKIDLTKHTFKSGKDE
ncbi:hypothetical protein BIZ82_gp205 [Erwinia phage vB_EamM_EarlPhillipIV]|nr:hypothetical protein BIZ82_gp205 [Erwinia phage vB_EamM_EarlPhillipIV]ANZ49054.1 hypothetical protein EARLPHILLIPIV_205 [Erwinia phage vB_EamM_EarlPhillipIV]QXO09925.1 hypothetical protein pEaSNUABM38_00203 [Erwinia phage pEa_SNUABM_38]